MTRDITVAILFLCIRTILCFDLYRECLLGKWGCTHGTVYEACTKSECKKLFLPPPPEVEEDPLVWSYHEIRFDRDCKYYPADVKVNGTELVSMVAPGCPSNDWKFLPIGFLKVACDFEGLRHTIQNFRDPAFDLMKTGFCHYETSLSL